MSSELTPQEIDPRAPLQAGDEGGTVEQTSGSDHGNDPTFKGTDHTRENIPVLAFGPKIEGRYAGHLATYADVAQTIAGHLALPPMFYGASLM